MKAILEKCRQTKMHKSRIQRLFRSKFVILLDIKNTSLTDFNIFWAADQALRFKMDRLDRTIFPRNELSFTSVWMQYIYTLEAKPGNRQRFADCLPWHRNLCKNLYLRLKDDMYWLQQQIAMKQKTNARKKLSIIDYQSPMALYYISIGLVQYLTAQKSALMREQYGEKKKNKNNINTNIIKADMLHISNFKYDYYRDMPLGAELVDIDYTPQSQTLYQMFIDSLNAKKPNADFDDNDDNVGRQRNGLGKEKPQKIKSILLNGGKGNVVKKRS